jgi:putative ABC transport system permease protein
VPSIVGLLSKEFAVLVAVAFVIATPLAYVALREWLGDFAYHIDLGPGVFLLAGGVALTVALLTVSVQATRAALTDPARALRYE